MIRVIIVAIDQGRGMGSDASSSGLPWRIPAETAYFRRVTSGGGVAGRYALVMGGNTYRKIVAMKGGGDDLAIVPQLKMKGRDVFLLSRHDYPLHNTVHNLNEIKDYDILFIGGGVQVYQDAVRKELVDYLLISKIKGRYPCDTFLPKIEQGFNLIKTIDFPDFTVEVHGYNNNIIPPVLQAVLASLS